MYRPLSATRTRSCEIRPCLRILSASNAATRSAPVLAWRDGGNLCVCRAGRCGHRPLRLFIGNRCVGVGLPDDPSRTCAAALAKLSLRASDRRHWCGNPHPRLLAGTARFGPAQILMPVLRISPPIMPAAGRKYSRFSLLTGANCRDILTVLILLIH